MFWRESPWRQPCDDGLCFSSQQFAFSFDAGVEFLVIDVFLSHRTLSEAGGCGRGGGRAWMG